MLTNKMLMMMVVMMMMMNIILTLERSMEYVLVVILLTYLCINVKMNIFVLCVLLFVGNSAAIE
jgi:hypothetical protein